MVLVGNKSDLADKRQVSTEEGRELAENYYDLENDMCGIKQGNKKQN